MTNDYIIALKQLITRLMAQIELLEGKPTTYWEVQENIAKLKRELNEYKSYVEGNEECPNSDNCREAFLQDYEPIKYED